MMLAQARKMEAAGRRDDALKLYRAALAAIRQAEAGAGRAAAARPTTGMVITAKRGKPGEQTAALNYATPAAGIEAEKVPEGTHRAGAGATVSGAAADAADWLRRAREFEAAGRRKDAMQAYRQAASVLRGGGTAPAHSPVHP